MLGGVFLKTTIEQLNFPCNIKNKLKMKVGTSNLDIKYIDGHIIKINKTNLSITEPHKIIAKNNSNTLIAYFINSYDYQKILIALVIDKCYF